MRILDDDWELEATNVRVFFLYARERERKIELELVPTRINIEKHDVALMSKGKI